MNLGNGVISKLKEEEKESIVLAKPVIDGKNSISSEKCSNLKEIITKINSRINDYQNENYKSIAIVGKDKKECEYIFSELNKIRKDVNLIQSKDSDYKAGINIVPSYLAKGLEFDCVMIFNANQENYQQNSLDIKLLYVVITRAMSKLDIYYVGEKTKLLKTNEE